MRKTYLSAVDETGKKYSFRVERHSNRTSLTLPREEFATAKKLYVLTEMSRARVGDDGFYILPRNIEQCGDLLVRFGERENSSYYYNKAIMSIYGVKTPNVCALVRFERSYSRIGFSLEVRDGIYSVGLVYDFTEHETVYTDIKIELFELPRTATYADMARLERELRLSRGEIDTLAEKCRREVVDYARRYPLIRIRMGWKLSPAQIVHQNEENEPDMFVACSFDRVCDIADGLKRAGLEGAELQLVGWNRSGHDGRFPQLFPADERLGGMDGLVRAIEHTKSLGYRISLHTNLIDEYELADTYTEDDLVVARDGGRKTGGPYSGGIAYHVCPEKQLKNYLRDLPALSSLGLNGVHFNDVSSIVEPDDCHSPDHPCNILGGIRDIQQILHMMRQRFGAVSSEGTMDFTLTELDYGLYVCFGDGFGHRHVPILDEYIPFFELIYHGILLYNPSSPTVNFPIKTPEDRLTVILRGGKPTFYIYSKFRTGAKNWMGENDLTVEDDEALDRTCRIIAEGTAELSRLADRQLIYMTDYQILPSRVHVATYADGVRIVGNFSDARQSFEGITLEPFAYAVV